MNVTFDISPFQNYRLFVCRVSMISQFKVDFGVIYCVLDSNLIMTNLLAPQNSIPKGIYIKTSLLDKLYEYQVYIPTFTPR